MAKQKLSGLFILLILMVSACAPSPVTDPMVIVEPTQLPPTQALPLTEADVPRVTVEQAKAALDAGSAIIVDVRSTESFLAGHIVGALSIPLTRIEAAPTSVTLDKALWIVIYCT